MSVLDADGREVWKLAAELREGVRRDAGFAFSRYEGVNSWESSLNEQQRHILIGKEAQAMVTVALGGYAPRVTVRTSETPSAGLTIRRTDADDSRVVLVIVARAEPIEDTTFTMIGWNHGHERHLGEWRGGWKFPAHRLPRSALHPFAELRDLIQGGARG